MSTTMALILSAFLIVINGFFVGVELAFVASRVTKLESMADKGVRGARIAAESVSNITQQLFAAQLGITICSILLGFIAEAAVAHVLESIISSVIDLPDGLLHGIGFAIALLFVTFMHTVFGEMVPKNVAIAHPETSARFIAPIHAVAVTVGSPIIWVLRLLARPLLRLAGIDPDAGLNKASTPVELLRMLDASKESGLVDEQEHALLVGALDFGDTRVRSVMIELPNIVSVRSSATVSDFEALVVEHGHSRIPVLRADGSDFRGFVHAKDLVRLPLGAQDDPIPLELIRRMPRVTIDQTVEDLLLVMQRNRRHMSLVVTGDGDVVGLATLEDVLEELVGEIYDETDQD